MPETPSVHPSIIARQRLPSPRFNFESWRRGALDAQVVRPLHERLEQGESVRLWVPAAGDGVAAYALALLLLGPAGTASEALQLRVFATDSDRDLLAATRAGRLTREHARPFLKSGFRRCFSWRGDRWQVKPAVRGRLICSVHDPLRSNSFGNLDLIYATNALARMPTVCGACVVRHFVNSLAPGGLLVAPPGLHLEIEFPELRPIDHEQGVFRLEAKPDARPRRRWSAPPVAAAALLERVVEHLAPTGLIVRASGEIIGTTGAGRETAMTAISPHPASLGTATAPQLRASLVNAFVSSVRCNTAVVQPVAGEDGLMVDATPLKASPLSAEPLWLVQLTREPVTLDGVVDEHANLRKHLVSTTEILRDSMDEVASRNLTLRTANDELQTSIDELEKSNRLLAAMNTELIAVRQEHEHHIDELNALNLDVENLFQAAELAVVVLDEAGRLRRYTPAAARLLNLARTDLGNAFASLLPRGLEALSEAARMVQAGGTRCQLSVELEGDTPLAGLARVHPYRGHDGRLKGTIVTITDVTELKAAQDRLQHQNLALTRANEDLERFAYIASHDLKSPLRSVRTMLEFLRSDLGDALADDNRQHLALVADRVQQMEQMIQDLLTYSRLGREARPPESVATDELIRAQIGLLDMPAGFAAKIEPGLPTLSIDVGLFEHVVRNLVDNAIKHHDRAEGQVSVRMVDAATVPTFEIIDDGPGIPARYRERVFEIFQKAGGRADAGGSGMGLALVKKAVERNGGEISIVDTPDERGTTFRFSWPESVASEVERRV